jgi:ABC-type methionine transport system ATPase subunit
MGKFNIYFIHFKINLTLKNVTYQNEIWHSVCQDVSVYCTGEITTHMILNVQHPWDKLDRRVRQRQPQPQTLQTLQQALQYEWHIIRVAHNSASKNHRLIGSMSRLVRTILQVNGQVVHS